MVAAEAKVDFLADQAFDRILTLLRNDVLRAGQFVSMPDLVKMIDIPLSPTREAVKKADTLSLVFIVPKRGVLIMEATEETTRNCLDLRCIFDQEGARRLAANPDHDVIREITQEHQEILELARHQVDLSLQKRAMGADWALHCALAAGLQNPLAQDVYALTKDKITILQHTRPLLPDRLIPAFQEHLEILAAIEKGDAALAAEAVRYHYQNIRRWWGLLD